MYFNETLPIEEEIDSEVLTRHFWCHELEQNLEIGIQFHINTSLYFEN